MEYSEIAILINLGIMPYFLLKPKYSIYSRISAVDKCM